MFRASLKEKFERIFDLPKVTFDSHGDKEFVHDDSKEQLCIFIEVSESLNYIQDSQAIAKVTGTGTVFANSDRLPYGYFSKKIHAAAIEDVKDLFFYKLEENAGQMVNIDQRSFSFIYLWKAQYNPNQGTLNQLEVNEA